MSELLLLCNLGSLPLPVDAATYDTFGVKLYFNWPEYFPGELCGPSIILENKMSSNVTVLDLGFHVDWFAPGAYVFIGGYYGDFPMEMGPGRKTDFHPVIQIPTYAAPINHTYSIRVMYQISAEQNGTNRTWTSDDAKDLKVVELEVDIQPHHQDIVAGDNASFKICMNAPNPLVRNASILLLEWPGLMEPKYSFSVPCPGESILTAVTRSDCMEKGTMKLKIHVVIRDVHRYANASYTLLPTPNFDLTVNPRAARLVAGDSFTFNLGLKSYSGFDGNVSLKVMGNVPGYTITFSPPILRNGKKVTMTVRTPIDGGPVAINIEGRSDKWSNGTYVELNVLMRTPLTSLELFSEFILLPIILIISVLSARAYLRKRKKRIQ